MKLVSFTVRNFRSITDAYKVPLDDFAVLVGPNNEGKSNVLKAIVTSLGILTRLEFYSTRRFTVRYRYRVAGVFEYDWHRDFPVALKDLNPDGKSEFVLEFQLDDSELADFNRAVQSNLSKNLRIKLSLGREDPKLEVVTQGRAKKPLTEKLEAIAAFIGERLEFQYIPAIRPSEMATDVVETMLARELGVLEKEPDYKLLLDQLAAAQKPILERIASELTGTVAGFVPEVTEVRLESKERLRQAVRTSCRVLVNDGTMTDLELKGDGIKSLIAISLLRQKRQAGLGSKSLILAVEEPESHLHPRAIHRLRDVLLEISSDHQVVITTHSPVLVDRVKTRRNILVMQGRAVPANNLKDVRNALGVELSDNLSGAYLVLLVEGDKDEIVLQKWLGEKSDELRRALRAGTLAIESLHGAANLKYKAGLYKGFLCNVHAFLDNDEEARRAVEKACSANLLVDAEYLHATCAGMKNSELEDLFDIEAYSGVVKTTFNVDLTHQFMGNSKKQWSDRVKDCFVNSGKPWTKATEARVKSLVAKTVAENGLKCLDPRRRGPFDALVCQLEERVQKA